MMARGYEVAVRLFRERGLAPGSKETGSFCSDWRTPQSFPEKNSPYFNYLLENQIQKTQASPSEPGFFGQLRTLMRRRALG